eukprot:3459618-Rhodomonas_salina.1
MCNYGDTRDSVPEPWALVVRHLYAVAGDLPVLYSEVDGGRWVCPRDARYVPETWRHATELRKVLLDAGQVAWRPALSSSLLCAASGAHVDCALPACCGGASTAAQNASSVFAALGRRDPDVRQGAAGAERAAPGGGQGQGGGPAAPGVLCVGPEEQQRAQHGGTVGACVVRKWQRARGWDEVRAAARLAARSDVRRCASLLSAFARATRRRGLTPHVRSCQEHGRRFRNATTRKSCWW